MTTQRRRGLRQGALACVLACLITPSAKAELIAQANFQPAGSGAAWEFAVSHPDGVRNARQASSPRLEAGKWVLRLGAATSSTRFAPLALDRFENPMVSWVMRVERARWNDDAFFEVRARGGGGEERVLARWDADALRAAKPGRGNFETARLPTSFAVVELVVAARASASRGSVWIDFFGLRVDGTNRSEDPPRAAEWERPPYLQKVGRDRATLRFRSRFPSATALRWWPEGAGRSAAREWRPAARATEHEARLSELAPETAYRYEVELDGQVMGKGAEHRFRTAPGAANESPITIWVVGDSGQCGAYEEGCERAQKVRDAFSKRAVPDLWLALGDNAYRYGADWEYSKALFQLYRRQTATTPLWPVPGNHDFYSASSTTQSGAYFEAFSLPTAAEFGGAPSGTEAYYSFDWGPIHFVALDSHDSDRRPEGPMVRWLEADLEAAAGARWRVAFFHHPPYSHGSHDSDDRDDSEGRMADMREVFLPLLERHGVDLVLAGHSHGYERSALIHGHYGPSDEFRAAAHRLAGGDGAPHSPYQKPRGAEGAGTVYAVVGSSSEAANRMAEHPVMVRSLARLGSLWVRVEGFSLRGRFVDDEGEILDDFEILKPQRVPGAARGTDDRWRFGPAWFAGAAFVLTLVVAAFWRRRRGPAR